MRFCMRTAGAAALVLAAACLPEHGPVDPVGDQLRMALRVAVSLGTAGAAGERVVEIHARFQRSSGELVSLPVQPTRVSISDDQTLQQPITIDVGPCNTDANRRASGDGPRGCVFTIELTLLNGAGEMLASDARDVGPVGTTPPTTPTFVLSTPNLTVAPASISFAATADQPVPPAQTVVVAATNSSAALGTIVAAVTFTKGDGWLRATVDQAAHSVSVQPTTTKLTPGSYTASVALTSSVEGMKPQSVAVTYVVGQPPVLTVTGGGSGRGTVTSSPAGISCTIASGATTGTCSAPFAPNATVTLSASPAANDRFTGWSGGCSGSGGCTVTLAQAVTVGATFNPATPVLRMTPATLSFNGLSRTTGPAAQTVAIENAGGGTLSGVAISGIRYDGSEPSWLEAQITGNAMSVAASPLNLPQGNYAATVTVTSSNGGQATVRVSFAVGAQPPVLGLVPTSLAFSAVVGGSSPKPQTVKVVNNGAGTLSGITVVRITYGGSEQPWLTPQVSGASVVIAVNPDRLTVGKYSAAVLVGSANGGSATLTVTFNVTQPPPVLGVKPDSISFSTLYGNSVPSGKTVRASNIGFGSFADLGTLSVASSTSSWLRVNFDGDIVAIQPNTTRLGPGIVTGNVTINSSRGGSATVKVTYYIAIIE